MITRSCRSIVPLLASGLVGLTLQTATADEFPPLCSKADGGQGNTSTTGLNFANTTAHIGDTVQLFPSLGMVAGACQAMHATGSVYVATGLLVTFLNNVTLDPNFIYQCPTNTSPPCTPGPYNLTITAPMVGAGVSSPGGSINGAPKTVRALQWSFSNQVRTGDPLETLDKLDSASISIVTPCILVQKFCNLPVGKTCFGPNEPILFRGFVTNCGDITLTNVTALDSRTGPLVLLNPATGLPLNPGNPTGPVTLAVGAFATFTNSYTPTQQEICAGNATNVVTARGTDTSDIGGPRASVTNSSTAICPICFTPCITVTKLCGPSPVLPGATQTISGVVSNCGNILLTNIVISDNIIGAVTNIASLPPGTSVSYSKSFTAGCVGNTNIVTARGTTICGQGVTNTATAPCLVTENPCIAVTKNCNPPVVQAGGIETFSGFVTNCGDITLTNVTLFDTFLNKIIATIPVLPPGTAQAYSTNYTTTTADCTRGTLTNTIIAVGRDLCNTRNVTNTASCTFIVQCPPCIDVTKEIACFLGTNAQGADICGTYSKFAVGVQGDTQNPAFCYRITVTNCADVPLTNVTVIDDKYGNLTAHFPGINPVFAPHATATFTFKAELDGASPPNNLSFVTNTVVATGRSAVTGQTVTDTDKAVAEIVPAAITCTKGYSVDGGPITNAVTLDNNPHSIVWYVTIRNTGYVNLGNVVVTDQSSLCNASPAPFSLAAGASRTIALCTNAAFVCTNNTGFQNTVRVVANQFSLTNVTTLCAFDIDSIQITVRTECDARIFCSVPNACRVTGGGRQDDPLVFPHDVRYVTHGGQVGAPVGNRVCEVNTNFFLGNPCIHGRWTHVRHVQGGLEGNFHARFFDTLDCACLDTNVGPGGVYGAGTVVGGLCNPDDHKVAGPQPRPAPANKIVFTGVGDWADPNGRRASRATLFRVDIEDRSEPGGSHPKGAVDPADRYRIRIWVLSATELAQLNGGAGDRYLINFRNAISACNGINVRDGVDVPNGTAVFGVRAPDIDDGGELERGNHQIHPAIKNCDPFNPTGPGLANP
jgi:hypothetical protein